MYISKNAQLIMSRSLLAFIVFLLIQACSLRPLAWQPPKAPAFEGATAQNTLLTSQAEWIDLEGWYGPEDIAVDTKGNLYCGVHKAKKDFSDGRILKISPNGKVSTFCNTQAWVTGLHFDQAGNLIACDQKRGLVQIDLEGNLKVLATKDEQGRPFLIPNDVDIATDGKIYFSNTSSESSFSLRYTRKLIFEVRPTGGLFCYDPKTEQVTTLIDSSYFGNGVAVAKDDAFVLMVDLTKYRILRYWLKGSKKGEIDVFIDNLPGIPNGISRRADGSFWLGFTTRRLSTLDRIQPKKGLKKMIYAAPAWLQPKQEAYGVILHLSPTGTILQSLHDPTGKRVSEASSIEEHQGYLYIGGDLTNHIGKYKCK